jgi:Restriction endonuclease XhoI
VLANIDARFNEAVQEFWRARERQQRRQIESGKIDAGTRGAVTGGAQMGALEVLLTDVLVDAGLSPSDIRVRTALELPGYYRPEKKWDLLVVAQRHLVLAVEFKSQVGPSFGNNFNNRTEEAIGNAEDIWTAYREGRFGRQQAPFLGYFFLLEDCPRVHAPVANAEPYFKVDPVFKNASYAKRYEILCERLILERKYNAACLALASKADPTVVNFPANSLSFRSFAVAAEAHARGFAALRKLSIT